MSQMKGAKTVRDADGIQSTGSSILSAPKAFTVGILQMHRNSDSTNLESDDRKKSRACAESKMTTPLVPRKPGQEFFAIHLAIHAGGRDYFEGIACGVF
ncbi:hypothetical protein [Symmachiella dynata]|uniref:hypothetical protein n=1 Tax=Symmachiella dynata TaxID=2527995 RepID=UPI0030EB8E44